MNRNLLLSTGLLSLTILTACSSDDGGTASEEGGTVSYGGSGVSTSRGGAISVGGSTATTAKGGSSGATTAASDGGSTAAGGALGQGGAQTSLGGATAKGGGSAAGGASAAGGTTAKGGSSSAGGATATGGTTARGGGTALAGTTSRGGSTSDGGSMARGGSSAAGGTTAIGGTTAKGGSSATGGTSTVGGTSSTGTTVNSCNSTATDCLPAVFGVSAGTNVPTCVPQTSTTVFAQPFTICGATACGVAKGCALTVTVGSSNWTFPAGSTSTTTNAVLSGTISSIGGDIVASNSTGTINCYFKIVVPTSGLPFTAPAVAQAGAAVANPGALQFASAQVSGLASATWELDAAPSTPTCANINVSQLPALSTLQTDLNAALLGALQSRASQLSCSACNSSICTSGANLACTD